MAVKPIDFFILRTKVSLFSWDNGCGMCSDARSFCGRIELLSGISIWAGQVSVDVFSISVSAFTAAVDAHTQIGWLYDNSFIAIKYLRLSIFRRFFRRSQTFKIRLASISLHLSYLASQTLGSGYLYNVRKTLWALRKVVCSGIQVTYRI